MFNRNVGLLLIGNVYVYVWYTNENIIMPTSYPSLWGVVEQQRSRCKRLSTAVNRHHTSAAFLFFHPPSRSSCVLCVCFANGGTVFHTGAPTVCPSRLLHSILLFKLKQTLACGCRRCCWKTWQWKSKETAATQSACPVPCDLKQFLHLDSKKKRNIVSSLLQWILVVELYLL